jgi:hypothetical protein
MFAEFHRESVERAGVQTLEEPLDYELGAQIQPLDLVDDLGFEIFFYGHPV